jgi:hypothetical protein
MAAEVVILKKVRQALKALMLENEVGTQNIFEAKNSEDKTAPCVLCGAENAVEDPVGSGNFWVEAVVMCKWILARDMALVDPGPPAVSDMKDPKPDSDALTLAVFQLLEVDDLAGRLTELAEDFTAFGFEGGKSFNEDAEGDCYVETWRRRVYCCAKDFVDE